jgi:hypothetical protein
LNVSFEPTKVSIVDIKNAVSKAGYKAVDDFKVENFKIEGMT